MKQTFIKTVQGHTLEFNRLLYPVRYAILTQDFDRPGIKILVEKDEKKEWIIKPLEGMPAWVSEIAMDIIAVVEENENSLDRSTH